MRSTNQLYIELHDPVVQRNIVYLVRVTTRQIRRDSSENGAAETKVTQIKSSQARPHQLAQVPGRDLQVSVGAGIFLR